MNPQPGQHVKCLMRNNTAIEGIVESWTDQKSILKSLDSQSYLIIQRSSDDIMVVKIIIDLPTTSPSKEIIKEQPIVAQGELGKEFIEVFNEPSDGDLRVKRLAELKKLMNEQEKKIISEKLKTHSISGDTVKKVKYGYLGFCPKPGNK